MHIVLLHYAAPPIVGGVESVLSQQARLLSQTGHTVTVLAGRGQAWDARIAFQCLPRLDSLHPDVLAIKAELDQGRVPPAFDALVNAINADLREATRGAQVLIAHNVASLHKNLALTVAIQRLTLDKGSPRLVLWHHDLAWTTPRYQAELYPGYPWDVLKQPWPGAQHVAVSELRRSELADLIGISLDEIHVIPAGINQADFYDLSPSTSSLANQSGAIQAMPLLLIPMRITRRKNLEFALSILAALRQKMPAAGLVVSGPTGAHNPANANYLAELQNQRKTLGLEGAAHFLAEFRPEGLSEAEVAEWYRLADAVLITSREEGFGIPILEAGLAGKPIFSTRLEPLENLAGPWASYFTLTDSPVVIAEQIRNRLENDPLYKLRRKVRSEYTWEAVYASRLEPLLRTL